MAQAPHDWTPLRVQIVAAIASGQTNPQVARSVGLTLSRTRHEIEALFTATRATCRGELVARAYTQGILDPNAWPPRPSHA